MAQAGRVGVLTNCRFFGWYSRLRGETVEVAAEQVDAGDGLLHAFHASAWLHLTGRQDASASRAGVGCKHRLAPFGRSGEWRFKATVQVLEAFRPLIAYSADRGAGHRAGLYGQLLRAIAVHRVADRPDRFEPRMAKRRPHPSAFSGSATARPLLASPWATPRAPGYRGLDRRGLLLDRLQQRPEQPLPDGLPRDPVELFEPRPLNLLQ